MRVLFCNWVDPLDPEGRGGGVAVYQRKRMQALDGAGIEAGYLSAGLAHDLKSRPPRWRSLKRPGHYEIVNSAVMAPGQASFGDARQIADAATSACFKDFLQKTGPWDAMHFDNLEGLPAEVLAVAAEQPGLRVILMLHNYYPFCPQVNLWRQERETCRDFDEGRNCTTCLPGRMASARVRRTNMAIAWRLAQQGGPRAVSAWRMGYGALRSTASSALALRPRRAAPASLPPTTPPIPPEVSAPFAERRARMISLINAHCDAVLCVSDRVRSLAQGFGVSPDLLSTMRIGSAEADRLKSEPIRPIVTEYGRIHLAYLGYMRRDKGFYFLLDALESLPEDLRSRVEVTIAAKRGDRPTMKRLVALRKALPALYYHDGYSHADLDRILAPATLGTVPVLWEDNLPQVALEMHLRGLPLLCSDLGGAQELGRSPDFVFPAGEVTAFHDRLRQILETPFDPVLYRSGASQPEDMQAHLAGLLPVWKGI